MGNNFHQWQYIILYTYSLDGIYIYTLLPDPTDMSHTYFESLLIIYSTTDCKLAGSFESFHEYKYHSYIVWVPSWVPRSTSRTTSSWTTPGITFILKTYLRVIYVETKWSSTLLLMIIFVFSLKNLAYKHVTQINLSK